MLFCREGVLNSMPTLRRCRSGSRIESRPDSPSVKSAVGGVRAGLSILARSLFTPLWVNVHHGGSSSSLLSSASEEHDSSPELQYCLKCLRRLCFAAGRTLRRAVSKVGWLSPGGVGGSNAAEAVKVSRAHATDVRGTVRTFRFAVEVEPACDGATVVVLVKVEAVFPRGRPDASARSETPDGAKPAGLLDDASEETPSAAEVIWTTRWGLCCCRYRYEGRAQDRGDQDCCWRCRRDRAEQAARDKSQQNNTSRVKRLVYLERESRWPCVSERAATCQAMLVVKTSPMMARKTLTVAGTRLDGDKNNQSGTEVCRGAIAS